MRFEKISFEQWKKDIPFENVDDTTLLRWYEEIKMPKQGSKGSMGVDFFMPYKVVIKAHNKVKIPTGIRWCGGIINGESYGLLLVPRSSIGIKKGMRLLNTIGVVDYDYYFSNNEGHIMAFMENTTDEDAVLEKGQGFIQGIITSYIIPECAKSDDIRDGGFGSTDNK